MLLLNRQPITAEEVCVEFGITIGQLKKLKKHSVFVINESRFKTDMGTRKLKTAAGLSFPATFFARTTKGKDVEIKFAASTSDKIIDNKIITTYEPKSVVFEGEVAQKNKIDEALFFYLHPKNSMSPIRLAKDSEVSFLPDYDYDDREAIAKKEIEAVDDLFAALDHARSVSGDDMILFAKGMGLGSVDNMDKLTIRAELSKLAQKDPANYLSRMDKQTTRYEGMVRDAIDKGVFLIADTFGNKRWVWGMGTRKGQVVVDITNQTLSENDILVNYLKEHIQDYYALILNVHNEVTATSKAEAFLNQLNKTETVSDENLDELPEIPATITEAASDGLSEIDVSSVSFPPADFKESMTYLTDYRNKRPSNALASRFLAAVKSQEVTEDNIDSWLEEQQ